VQLSCSKPVTFALTCSPALMSTVPRLVSLLALVFYLSGLAFPMDGNATKGSGERSRMNKMKITIGSKTFTATLYENPTVAALKAMLPLTVEMTELNGNEKYSRLATNLPVDAAKRGTIQAGDLMLWQSNSLVLFYKTFRTSYSYTNLGRIDDPSGLAAAVGSGNVKVRFELERNDE
jgi:hypothetical protein